MRGLCGLLGFLHTVAASDEYIRIFHSQTISALQMVPVLFQHTLQQSKDNPAVSLEHILGAEPMKIVGPATDSEIALALRVLEGCCLLRSGSAALAHKQKSIKVYGFVSCKISMPNSEVSSTRKL